MNHLLINIPICPWYMSEISFSTKIKKKLLN